MGVLRIILLFLVALIPFGQIVRVELFRGIEVLPLDIIVLILSFYLLSLTLFRRIKPKLERFHLFLIAFLLVGFISLFIKAPNMNLSEFLNSFGYSLRFVFYIIPLFFLPSLFKKRGEELLSYLVFVGFIFVIFGIFQYIYLPRLELLIFLGEWDIHSFRLFSSFFDPNFAGLFIAFEIILLYIFISLKNKYRHLYWTMLGVSYISLFLTYSRSSIVALAAGTIFFLLFQKKYKILIGFFLLFIISMASLYMYSLQFGGEGVKIFRTASAHTRIVSFQEGLDVFKENPLIGSGFNTYRYARKNFSGISKYDQYSNASNAPSNSFIFILATTGILGFGFFSLFIIYLGKTILLLYGVVKEKVIVASLMASFVILLTHSLFQNSFFYSPIVIVFVLFTVGVLTYDYSRE